MPGGTLRCWSQDVTAPAPAMTELAGGKLWCIIEELDRGINLLRDDSLINNLDVMSLITTWEFLINSQMLRAYVGIYVLNVGKRTKILKYSHVNDQAEINRKILTQKSNSSYNTYET